MPLNYLYYYSRFNSQRSLVPVRFYPSECHFCLQRLENINWPVSSVGCSSNKVLRFCTPERTLVEASVIDEVDDSDEIKLPYEVVDSGLESLVDWIVGDCISPSSLVVMIPVLFGADDAPVRSSTDVVWALVRVCVDVVCPGESEVDVLPLVSSPFDCWDVGGSVLGSVFVAEFSSSKIEVPPSVLGIVGVYIPAASSVVCPTGRVAIVPCSTVWTVDEVSVTASSVIGVAGSSVAVPPSAIGLVDMAFEVFSSAVWLICTVEVPNSVVWLVKKRLVLVFSAIWLVGSTVEVPPSAVGIVEKVVAILSVVGIVVSTVSVGGFWHRSGIGREEDCRVAAHIPSILAIIVRILLGNVCQ